MNSSLSVLYNILCGCVYTARVDMLMLQAMLRSNILQTTPLLVLSCQPSGTQDGAPSSPSLCPPVEVANTLRLCELQQPWQVLYTHAQIVHSNDVHVHYSIDGICYIGEVTGLEAVPIPAGWIGLAPRSREMLTSTHVCCITIIA